MILTVSQFAERSGLKKVTVRDLLRAGFLAGFRQGKRTWGILMAELGKWLSSRGNQTPAGTAK